LIYLVGPLGIGKTDACKIVFRKQLADWTVLQLRLAKDSKPARLLGELARNVGVRLDIDALGACPGNGFGIK
jgi:hypothetical protein